MRLQRTIVVAAVAAVSVLPACADDESDSARLEGVWRTPYGHAAAFDENGTWSATARNDEEPFDVGTYTMDGSRLTLDTGEGSTSCGVGAVGSFEVTFVDDDTADLELIDDECSARGDDMSGGLVRINDEE